MLTLDGGICVFNTSHKGTIQTTTKEIAALTTDDKYEITFTSGEKIKGKLYKDNNNNLSIDSDVFNKTKIDFQFISSMIKIITPKKELAAEKNQTKSFGKEEKQTPPLNFLADSTILLSPKTFELEIGIKYNNSHQSNPLTQIGYFQLSAFTARKLELTTTARVGLYDKLESWLSMPCNYTYIEDVSTNKYVRSTDSWDMGDISFGLQYLMLPENQNFPALSSIIRATAPTGKMHYRSIQNRWKDPLNNGNGHWILSYGLSFVRSLDPAILFCGISYQHPFAATIDNYKVTPGWSIFSYLGIGFALNERLSLGSRLGFAYNSEMTVDGDKIYGSGNEPIDLSFSASYRFAKSWVATPEVTFPLNKEAGTAAIAFKLSKKF